MIIFDEFKDALEDAKWSADHERVRQYIYLQNDGKYRVTPKYNSRDLPKQAFVEVGIIPRNHMRRKLRKSNL